MDTRKHVRRLLRWRALGAVVDQNTYTPKVAADWVANGYHDDLWAKALQIFIDMAAGKTNLLEIGYGSGHDAAILARHFIYTGIDLSRAMKRLARKAYPGLRFLKGNVRRMWRFRANSFDAGWIAAMILHTPKAELPGVLRELRRVYQNGSIVFMSLKEGEVEGWFEEPSDGGVVYYRYFAFWQLDEIRPVLAGAGFVIEDFLETPDPDREDVTWLQLFLRLEK